jgi:hypothetical protein
VGGSGWRIGIFSGDVKGAGAVITDDVVEAARSTLVVGVT